MAGLLQPKGGSRSPWAQLVFVGTVYSHHLTCSKCWNSHRKPRKLYIYSALKLCSQNSAPPYGTCSETEDGPELQGQSISQCPKVMRRVIAPRPYSPVHLKVCFLPRCLLKITVYIKIQRLSERRPRSPPGKEGLGPGQSRTCSRGWPSMQGMVRTGSVCPKSLGK